ncbi:MAG: 2-nitropropane dioxygenase [Verrucomicrobiales bacterium]|nr:2-nitropropane dioxygenase [Verrucomicrobiales bacterium]
MPQPKIIQGGMGAAVSNWRLARAVSKTGQLGVVSGTALSTVLVRRLQLGDADGAMRRALAHFPIPEIAGRIVTEYLIEGGKPPGTPFKTTPMLALHPGAALVELTVAANFVEVFLAKEGHEGLVGINLLEKIQLPTLPSLFGAMLAGVDYVLMGAGIPRTIPGALDHLADGRSAELKIDVEGALPGEEFFSTFDPRAFCGAHFPGLKRPQFLAIVASSTLAATLAKKSNGRVDGFVIESQTAGGHNAPPRGPMQLSGGGEPVYGPRDLPEIQKIGNLGLPFWLAGSYGHPDKLATAISLGATGIQVGTAFAFCEESGIDPELKHRVIELSRSGKARVFTDPVASPTGFPFKVLQMDGTLSDLARVEARPRICDLGYLRQNYRKADGTIGYRCPAEPVDDFIRKGGTLEQTVGRICVCNGLTATVGLAQIRGGNEAEPALLTAGNDVANLSRFLRSGEDSYSATDVVNYLLGESNV